jgi:predicted O-methyltransferase YrrM
MTLPGRVIEATALVERLHFAYSCTEGTGRLLACLAAATTGPVGESGTGCGYGTAWLRSGLREGERLVTVDHDAECAAAVRELFADDPAVTVLHDDWRALTPYSPFGLLFLDGGGKPDGPDAVADLMAPGGIVVMDDFTPCDAWPPTHQGEPDTLRISWLTDSRFASTEVRTEADHAALICTRR